MANKYVMLVEGDDDYHVFQHLMKAHGLDRQISWRLEPYGAATRTGQENEIVFRERQGYNNVRDYLSQQLRITGDLKQLGVVVDADLDFAARWQSLRDVLVGAGYADAPVQAETQGLVLEHSETPDEKPRVGSGLCRTTRMSAAWKTSLRCFCRQGMHFGNGRGCASSKSQ